MTISSAKEKALHPVCGVVRLRALRQTLWMRQVWANMPASPHPSAIQHEEVDRILSDPQDVAAGRASFFAIDPEAAQLGQEIEGAERELAEDVRWSLLTRIFSLTTSEQHLLVLALAIALDPMLGRVFAYLHDQPEMVQPTPWLSAELFEEGTFAVLLPESPLLAWRLLRRAPEVIAAHDAWRGWTADPALVAWLCEGPAGEPPHGIAVLPPERFEALPRLYEQDLESIERALSLHETGAVPKLEIELIGPAGSGRKTLAGQIAARRCLSLLAVAAGPLLEGVPEAEVYAKVLETIRASMLCQALLYWDEGPEASAAARRVLREIPGAYVVGRTAPLPELPPQDVLLRSVELQPLSRAAREGLWRTLSAREAPRQVRDWLLTPGEIARLVQVASAGDAAIHQACRRPTESLSLLARMPLPFVADDLILPEAIREQLLDFESQVRLRWDVYEDWGFDRLCPNGRGLVALFAGPSGTGKTMAAQVLARELGLELFRLDPAQVVNKYIGETEKRLKTIFDECDRAHFLLLIDECEGMFGQRFSSKDAHDRYANLEIDYLLQRLERFQGVAVLATNRKGDLDPAFLRRVRFVIDFLPPGPAERAALWKSAIPAHSPSGVELRGAIDWAAISEKATLTGAEIKLAALNAAFLAYGEQQKIGMSHIVKAIRRELAKKGQTLRGLE